MTWFAWRQFRTLAWITGGILVAIGALLAVSGHSVADQWVASGAAACHGGCDTALRTFNIEVASSANGVIYQLSLAVVYVVANLMFGSRWACRVSPFHSRAQSQVTLPVAVAVKCWPP